MVNSETYWSKWVQNGLQWLLVASLLVLVGCGAALETEEEDDSSVDPFESTSILELKFQPYTTNAVQPVQYSSEENFSSCSPKSGTSAALSAVSACVDIGGLCSTGGDSDHIILWELQDSDNNNVKVVNSRDWEGATNSLSANAKCKDGYFIAKIFLPTGAELKSYRLEARIYGVDELGQLREPLSNPSNVDSKILDFSVSE